MLAQFPEHDEDSIRWLATYDPTDAKYLTWILTVLRREGGGLTPEAGEELRRNLERFERVKRLPGFLGSRDINQYRTFEDFNREMATASQLMSRSEQEKTLKKLATYNDYTLFRILTEPAAKKFAQNTGLCFVGDYYARRYIVEQPPLYGVYKGKERVAALHPPSNQYHDMNNRPISGELRRAVRHLARRSREPLLVAWYTSEIEKVKEQIRQRRIERRREQRRALLRRAAFRNGVSELGEHAGHTLLAFMPSHGRVLAFLPEARRETHDPVLVMEDGAGVIEAVVDPYEGTALDAQGQQLEGGLARVAGAAFEGFVDDVAPPWLKRIAREPREYRRNFDYLVEQIHERFIAERINGYTDPRNRRRYDPITQEEAEQRWNAFEPRMVAELRKGSPRLRLPGIGMARMLGYTERIQ